MSSNVIKESKTAYFFDIYHIHVNPVRAGIVDKPEDYLYSSARNYLGEKGLLEIEPIIVYRDI